MVVIPGLSRLLEAAGKRVTAWDDSGSCLVVEAGSVVESAIRPRCACGSARLHGRRELHARSFTGGRSIVRDAVAAAVRKIPPPSARGACARVLGLEKRKLARDERSDRRRFVETLCHIEPAIAEARSLALRFMGLVRPP